MLLSKALGRVVFVGLLAALVKVCEGAASCPTGLPPAGLTLGLNDAWRGQALYQLDVGRARFGYRPHHYYKLGITSSDSDLPFSDAIITLKEEDPDTGCGIGHFQFDTDDLFQYSGCRRVILTNKKQPMTQLPPFSWKAPGCGCIMVNATVIRNGSTYYMDQKQSEGVLSKRICPMQNKHTVRNSKVGEIQTTKATTVLPKTSAPVKPHKKQKMSRTDRMDLLCQISLKYNGAELLAREVFLRRREISSLNMTSLIRLELALDQRRGDIHQCCKISSNTERTKCFDNKRRRRIDRFCRVGVPDIPFTARRAAFMKEKEADCCWRLGEYRYRCFGQKARPMPEKGENSVEYSQDEMDPVNDVGDYPSEIDEIAKDVNSDFFVDHARKDAVITVRETLTFTVPTTTTTTTTTTTATTTTTPTTTAQLQANAPKPNIINSMVRRHLSTGVVSDDTMTTGRHTSDSTVSGSTKKSSVDEELEVLSLKKWKLETKLACCRKGKSVGESIDILQGIYNHCRHQWRSYRKGMKKGRNMCMNKFMECCVDEAGMSSTQATYTRKSHPGDPASETRPETTTHVQKTQLVTTPQRRQGQTRGSVRKLKRKGNSEKVTEPTNVQTRRTKNKIGKSDDGQLSVTSFSTSANPDVTSSPSTVTSMMSTVHINVRKVLDEEENVEDTDGGEEESKEEDTDSDENEEMSDSFTDKSISRSVSNSDEDEDDVDDEDRSKAKKERKTAVKTLKSLKPRRRQLNKAKPRTTTVQTVENVSVKTVSVKRKSGGNSRSRRVRKHKRRHRKRHRQSRNDRS